VKKEKKFVTPEEGLRFFYKQILMGDAADNIKGMPRVGVSEIGEDACAFPDGERVLCVLCGGTGKERVLENGRLLWLRRKPNEHGSHRMKFKLAGCTWAVVETEMPDLGATNPDTCKNFN
jgi:hypothetical protein